MRKYAITIFAFLFAALLLSGCSGKKYDPVAINEDTAKCVICNMQVKDDAFATQLTTTKGKTYLFDDIGCLNEWRTKNPNETIGAQYVRDYNDLSWVPYDKAYYAYDASFRSPMAYGIYSFKDRESAQRYIDDQKTGTLLTAADLGKHSWAQNMDQMNGDMSEMGSGDHDENAHSENGMGTDSNGKDAMGG